MINVSSKDRDGHGPEFLKHMVRINDATGANITVRNFNFILKNLIVDRSKMKIRFIIRFMTNTIIFMDIGGVVQVRVEIGNLSMVLSNDR